MPPDLSRSPVAVEPCPKRVRVVFGGETVADSDRVRLMHERGHTPVYYFPTGDVRSDLLEAGERSYHCPRKGDARFWSGEAGGEAVDDAGWCYERPRPEAWKIAGRIAFFSERVTVRVDGERVEHD